MTRLSPRVALVCATALLAALVCCSFDAGAQDKKVDKKTDKKVDKKTDKKTKDKGKKEEPKKVEYKPDVPQAELKSPELKGHKNNWIYAIAYGADGKTLASCSRDRTARFWDVAKKAPLTVLEGTSDKMQALVMHHGTVYVADSVMVATKVKDKDKKEKTVKVREYLVRVWDAAAGKQRPPLKGHTDWIRCLAVTSDGKKLYSGGDDDTVLVRELPSGKVLNTIKAHTAPVMAVALNQDGSLLATGGSDGTVKLWDQAGKELASFKVEKEVKTVDPKTKKVKVAKETGRAFLCVAFSPDGKRLAGGNYDGFVKVWDVQAKKEVQELKGHEGVWSLAYSPDGTRLATAGYGGLIKLWDQAAKELRTIKAGSASRDTITTIAFSPDGTQLASGSLDALIKVWNVGTMKK